MTTWIHVVTATKLPQPRGANSTPYEEYTLGFDPNAGTPFGPTEETMFLEVQSPAQPVVNPVLEQVNQVQTVGTDGKTYHGAFVDPYWVQGWVTSTQDLAVSKEYKLTELNADRDVFIAAGYTVGPFQFPLTEHFFRLLADRLRWLEDAIAALAVPSNTQLTFSDLADQEVSVGYDTLKTHFVNFGKEYLRTFEIVVNKTEAIEAQTTPAEVDAVTWVF